MSTAGAVRVVIVGNGIAGNEVAAHLRALGSDGAITCLSAEACPAYDPCSLTYFVGQDVPREMLFCKCLADYQRQRIDLVLEQEAVSIDPRARTVTTAKGSTIGYDKLVLAHGASSFVPPVPGVGLPGVFACKRLADADALAHHQGSSAVVIGSGAIGIEVAEALAKRGYRVSVVELLDWILPTLFDEPGARLLAQRLRAHGIDCHCAERVTRIDGRDTVERVVTSRRELDCDTVVLAAGVVPGAALARTAGIAVGRGIRVDDRMRTSVADIWACGDCAEPLDALTAQPSVYALKHNAIDQARIVAASILGLPGDYRGAYPFARVHFFDTHAVSFGLTSASAREREGIECFERSTSRGYLRLVLEAGRLRGGQAIGPIADHVGPLLGAMWRGDDLGVLRARWAEIVRLGSPWPWTYRRLGRLLGLSSLT